MRLDASDIKYLLEKKGFSLSDVARQVGVTPQCVHLVVRGVITSKRVAAQIAKLLGYEDGKLRIAKAKQSRLKAA